jgi:hypothetical protein
MSLSTSAIVVGIGLLAAGLRGLLGGISSLLRSKKSNHQTVTIRHGNQELKIEDSGNMTEQNAEKLVSFLENAQDASESAKTKK